MNTKFVHLLILALGFLSAGAKTLNVTNCLSIADAINHANAGDTVCVPNRIYYISISIEPKSGIRLTDQSQSGVFIRPVVVTIVQGSTDPIKWVNLQNNTAPLTFIDFVASNFSCHYYNALP